MNFKTTKRSNLGFIAMLSILLVITPSCEPPPKMVGYGNNQYGQLSFEGTNYQDQPLAEGYSASWAGGSFNLAYLNQSGLSDSLLICRGNNLFGQCDIPNRLKDFTSNNGSQTYDFTLGSNHGMAWVDSTFSGNFGTVLYLWGDDTYGQVTYPEIPDSARVLKMAAGGNHNIIYIANITYVSFQGGPPQMEISNPQIVTWGDNTYGQCDTPERFQYILDSTIVIRDVYAGSNHTIITYDSLDILKMAAWGDNTHGQSDVLTESELNGDKTLYELHCGNNHNLAVFINFGEDIMEQLYNDEGYVDSLFYVNYDSTSGNGPNGPIPTLNSVSVLAWGDNSYGQCDIPNISGLFEDIGVGGDHNSLATTNNSTIMLDQQIMDGYGWWPYVHNASGRSITGWGKNDQGQTSFPLEYIIDWIGPSSAPGAYNDANSAPIVTLGGDHTLVRGSHIYRAPSIDNTFPDQFNGAMGDTIFQTITLYSIGPDTVYLDSILLATFDENNQIDLTENHPFYFEEPEMDYILFEDSLNLQIYCIYDSLHEINEAGQIVIYSRGWWADTTTVPINSFFGPEIRLYTNPNIFIGNYGETVVESIEFHNTGNATAYIEDIILPDFFDFEPFGEDDFILPNDSLAIDIYTTLPESPFIYSGTATFVFSNYNSSAITFGLNARRYMKAGDNLSLTNYYNSGINYCGQQITETGYLSLSALSNPGTTTKVHHLDFGYFDGVDSANYGMKLDSLSSHFQNNSYFVSMLGIDRDSLSFPNSFDQDCDSFINEFEVRENKLVFLDDWFDLHFNNDVQSVVIDHYSDITYVGQFNQDSVILNIQEAIDNCGIGCLQGNVLALDPDTLDITMHQNSTRVDTFVITNSTEYELGYHLDVESGNELVSSILFHDGSGGDEMYAPVEWNNSPITISLWLKPLETDWSAPPNDQYTNLLSPVNSNSVNYWEIILDNYNGYPVIGWKDNENYLLSDRPILPTGWYHCVFVYDFPNQVVKLYMNGEQQFSHPISQEIQSNSGLGINMVGPGTYTGFLSATSIWATALSEPEIITLHNLGTNANLSLNIGNYESAEDLITYWKVNEQEGYTILDYSGNGFHADVLGTENIWRTELIQAGEPWLRLLGGSSQTISPNSSQPVTIEIVPNSLEVGNYVGLVQLVPDYNLSAMAQNIVNLTITEELETKANNILPAEYTLHQNFPNPFNPYTNIRYDLPKNEEVQIEIFDMLGKKIRLLIYQKQIAGFHKVQWDGKDNLGRPVSSGMYLYMLKAGQFKKSKKMVILK